MSADQFVADVITMPAVTPLLAAAQQKGCRTQNGVEMFEAQVDFITEFLLGQHSHVVPASILVIARSAATKLFHLRCASLRSP